MKGLRFKFIFFVALIFAFVQCKKSDDPAGISIRTKKGKLSHRWVMTSGNIGLTVYSQNAAPDVLSVEFDGSNGIITQSNSLYYGKMKYSLAVEFAKNGKMSMSENINGIIMNASGRWDFGSGVGDRKRKEDIFLQLNNVTSSDSRDHFFNHFSTEVSYAIEKISADELKIFAYTNYYVNSNGDKGTIESNYTLKKQ